MHSVEHTLKLKDGRLLAYHTFPNAEEEEEEEEKVKIKVKADKEGTISITTAEQEQEQERHPVLYFHGYPSCGLEGGVTSARSVARAGGRLYAIDRPGMGKISSPYYPYNNNKDEDKEEEKEDNNYNNPDSNSNTNLDTFVENVWELVEDQGWNDFSILGLSGGGPYILAVLASYLQRMEKQKYKQKEQQQHQSSDDNSNGNSSTKSLQALPRLRNVCLVCAICMSAGSDGIKIKSDMESMNTLVESASTSRISRFWLHTFALTQGIVNSYILPILPISWIQKGMMANAHTPIADQQWIVSNEGESFFSNYIPARASMAAQGQLLSNPGIYDDTLIVIRAHHSHEDIIRKHYNNDDDGDTSANNTNTNTNTNSSSSSSSNNTNKDDNDLEQDDDDDDDDLLPAVGIFQGASDINVPLSHAQFMHQSIFNEHKRSKLILYEDLGHLSTIGTKSGDYAAFATRTRTRTITFDCTNK